MSSSVPARPLAARDLIARPNPRIDELLLTSHRPSPTSNQAEQNIADVVTSLTAGVREQSLSSCVPGAVPGGQLRPDQREGDTVGGRSDPDGVAEPLCRCESPAGLLDLVGIQPLDDRRLLPASARTTPARAAVAIRRGKSCSTVCGIAQ